MLRVVLYAEGAGETLGSKTLLPSPTRPLTEAMLGAAHLLLRRALQEARKIEPHDIRFEAPLRLRGRLPRGSDLLSKTSLSKLLSWPRPRTAPDLVVVLVDADGDRQRGRKLEAATQNLPVPHVTAVAVQEFEAWLIADHETVAQVIGRSAGFENPPPPPENLEPREAKQQLGVWLSAASEQDDAMLRRQIAERCNLELLRKKCPSFARFSSELASITC